MCMGMLSQYEIDLCYLVLEHFERVDLIGHISTPKRLGEAALLYLHEHMVVQIHFLSIAMFGDGHPWTEMVKFFIHKA